MTGTVDKEGGNCGFVEHYILYDLMKEIINYRKFNCLIKVRLIEKYLNAF
jgi:hypothetical protein